MIAEGHATGYSIKAEIERSTRPYWGASVGGIYPELRRLAKAGLVSVFDNPRGGTQRHSYSLTDAGEAALREWLTDTSEAVLEMRNEPLLRLRFAGVLDPEQRLGVVHQMREVYESRALEARRRLEIGEFDDPFLRMTTEFGLAYYEWGRDWCAQAEQRCRPTDSGLNLSDQRIER